MEPIGARARGSSCCAVSNAAVMVAMPMIGAYADLHARKQWLLRLSTIGCVLSTAALALAGRGDVAIAVVAIVDFEFFLSDRRVADRRVPAGDRASTRTGQGVRMGLELWLPWRAGDAGCLPRLCELGAAGRAGDAEDFVPVTMLITAGIFALAALPTLFILRERAVPQAQRSLDVVRGSMSRLGVTLKHVGRYRDFARLLVCGAFYQAGVAVVIALAAIYAQEVMKFSFEQTMLLMLVVNITAAIGAFAFGYVQDWLGHKLALALTLLLWIAMTVSCSRWRPRQRCSGCRPIWQVWQWVRASRPAVRWPVCSRHRRGWPSSTAYGHWRCRSRQSSAR